MPQTIEAINHLRLLVFQSLRLTRLINQVLTQNVLSVNWLSLESFQQHGVWIVNSLKSQLNLDKTLKNCLKPFFLWLKWKSLKRIQVFVLSVPLLARLDKGMRLQPPVQQGTFACSKPTVVGNTFRTCPSMTNDLGRRIKTAAPSTPV